VPHEGSGEEFSVNAGGSLAQARGSVQVLELAAASALMQVGVACETAGACLYSVRARV